MSDVRARLADALRDENLKFRNGHLDGIEWCLATADILLSLDGIAVVELPAHQENDGPDWRGEGWSVWPDTEAEPPELVIRSAISMPVGDGLAFAAALLAAVNAAETGDPNE